MIIYTSAPPAYDYGYMEDTGRTVREHGTEWRVLIVHDPERFEAYQLPRYQSGLYSVIRADRDS